MQWGLTPGASNFLITAATNVNDGCMLDVANPTKVIGSTLPVNYDMAAATISIGSPQGTPTMPSLGSGPIGGNMATLMRENETGDGTGCTWHQKDVSMLVLTYHDQFSLSVTENESNFDPKCSGIPTGGMCTSSWTWMMQKQ
jgi:hypothetical protein